MIVDIRLLRSFPVVADELHFGRAAGRLHVSQPALSHEIRKLEADRGADLFVRDRRSVSLTGTGLALLESARVVVDASQEFAVAARRAVTSGGRPASARRGPAGR
ncbi:MAG: LysR family transcriptional regulator [Kineosporiaceae bacterium]